MIFLILFLLYAICFIVTIKSFIDNDVSPGLISTIIAITPIINTVITVIYFINNYESIKKSFIKRVTSILQVFKIKI